MRLGCKMHHRVYPLLFHQRAHSRRIGNVGMDKAVVWRILYRSKIGQIAGIREQIDIDHPH